MKLDPGQTVLLSGFPGSVMGMRVPLAMQMRMGVNQVAVPVQVGMARGKAELNAAQEPSQAEQGGAEKHDCAARSDIEMVA